MLPIATDQTQITELRDTRRLLTGIPLVLLAMTSIKLFQVDAFARTPFSGNPAAVCPLERWLPVETMQSIAGENNLSETAFFVPVCPRSTSTASAGGDDDDKVADDTTANYHLRWFTPTFEIDLCGHATLASAHVLYNELGYTAAQVVFSTLSGLLTVHRDATDGKLLLNFPSRPPSNPLSTTDYPADLVRALGPTTTSHKIVSVQTSRDLVVEFGTAEEVLALDPDFSALRSASLVRYIGLIATAPGVPGSGVDFVSRFFAPEIGAPEDPVTGSAHCTLVPFWAAKLGKIDLFARQESKRGGELWCRLLGDRVEIGGYAVTFMRGEIVV